MPRNNNSIFTALAIAAMAIAALVFLNISNSPKTDTPPTPPAEDAAKAKSGAGAPQTSPNAPPPFVSSGKTIKTASGLQYDDMAVGTGPSPKNGDTVSVDYIGTLENGDKFDASYDRGRPIEFPLGAGKVIQGWDEGILTMKVGGRRKLIIPASLGYGEMGSGGKIPPGATLIFDVILRGVTPASAP